MFRRILYQSNSNHSKTRQIHKNSTRFKKLNDAIHKNKYQMQSIDHLMETIACKISEVKQKTGTLYFSKIDLKYAYSQVLYTKIHKNIAISTSSAVTLKERTDS